MDFPGIGPQNWGGRESCVDTPEDIPTTSPEEQDVPEPDPSTARGDAEPEPEAQPAPGPRPGLYRLRPPGLRPRGVSRPRRRHGVGHSAAAPPERPSKNRGSRDRGPR